MRELQISEQTTSYDIKIGELPQRFYHIAKDEGVARTLEITDTFTGMEQGKVQSQIYFLCPSLGLSIIAGDVETRQELLYITFKGMEIYRETSERKAENQMRVKFINIDNNLQTLCHYPVLLTPAISMVSNQQKQSHYLDFYMSNSPNRANVSFFLFFLYKIHFFNFLDPDSQSCEFESSLNQNKLRRKTYQQNLRNSPIHEREQ